MCIAICWSLPLQVKARDWQQSHPLKPLDPDPQAPRRAHSITIGISTRAPGDLYAVNTEKGRPHHTAMVINNSEIQLFLSQASVTKLFGNGQVLYDCKNEDACILKFHLLLQSLNDRHGVYYQ